MVTIAGASPFRTTATIVLRIGAALPGNYAAIDATGSLLAILLAAAGMARSDAVVLASIVAILAFLVVLLWAFHTPRLLRFWVGLLIVTGIATALCRVLAPVLP
ncbi:hypothetical protein [Sphingomonas sp. Leaf4]|uniref:hypothetical protein n=1 Tax=Sphingomonas sp. Leaf4 TaxID=2876553 RepID=UPI001E351156|nr:hypothetical protein [Sphingomonas sp. Leaf4]